MRRASRISRSSSLLLFSQYKSTRSVADIWANGKKLHVQYSDGSSKDMDVPSSGIQFSRIEYDSGYNHGSHYTRDVESGEVLHVIAPENRGYIFYGWIYNLSATAPRQPN